MRGAAASAAALAALLLTAAPAQAGERQKATVLMPENERQRAFQENWGFADAVVSGDTIYLSGLVVDRRPGDADLAAAYERVYAKIETILKRAGASWDDVVDLSSFHSDVDKQIEAMVSVHKKYVKAPYPAWTAIGVTRILGGGITEIKVVAKRPKVAATNDK